MHVRGGQQFMTGAFHGDGHHVVIDQERPRAAVLGHPAYSFQTWDRLGEPHLGVEQHLLDDGTDGGLIQPRGDVPRGSLAEVVSRESGSAG